jgi:branched-chain amino acid transport system substrate-binding protein
MKQYDPAALGGSGSIEAATEAWASATVMGAAARAAHFGSTPSPQEMIAGLNTIKNDTFGGLTPPLTYANGANLQVPTCAYELKIVRGQYQLLNGGKPACLPYAEVAQGYKLSRGG